MAKNNKTNNNNNNVNSQQETVMSKSINSIEDLFNANKENTKQLIKSGKAGMSEFKQLMKDIAKEKKEIKVNRDLLLQQAGDDKLLKLQIKQHAELLMLEVDKKYEKDLERMQLYTVENAEAIANVVVDKSAKYVAPVTRGVAEGVRSIGEKLFGFKRK